MANVIVTGGAGALGSVVVSELAARGHRVASVDLAKAPAGSAASLVLGEVDLADETAVERAYADVAKAFDSIDALVNIAGGFVWEPVTGGSLDSWDRMYRMNVRTATVSSRAALAHFGEAGGAIVNMGAAGAMQPGLGMAPYAASKAGVHALTQSLADETRARNIRVNAILPTIIDTPANRRDMPDADRSNWVSPASIANVVAFLISPEAGAITGAMIPLSLAA